MESTSVLSRATVVRATGSAEGLGRFSSPLGSPGPTGGKWRRWGAWVPSSWPLYRCVQADSWVSGQHERRLDWRLPEASVSGSCCSLPKVGNHPTQSGHVKAGPERGLGVRWACSGSVLVAEVSKRRRAQRSHLGCGQGGGRGPSRNAGNRRRRKDVWSHATRQRLSW